MRNDRLQNTLNNFQILTLLPFNVTLSFLFFFAHHTSNSPLPILSLLFENLGLGPVLLRVGAPPAPGLPRHLRGQPFEFAQRPLRGLGLFRSSPRPSKRTERHILATALSRKCFSVARPPSSFFRDPRKVVSISRSSHYSIFLFFLHHRRSSPSSFANLQARAWAQVEATRAVTAFEDVPFREEPRQHLHALPLVIGLQEWPAKGTPRETVFVEVGVCVSSFCNFFSCLNITLPVLFRSN